MANMSGGIDDVDKSPVSPASPLVKRGTVLALSAALSFVMINMLLFASGVRPVPYVSLVAIAIAIAGAICVPAILLARFRIPFLVLSIVACIGGPMLSAQAFMHLVNAAFADAKEYGESIAREIARLHAETDTWPESLSDLPPNRLPSFPSAPNGGAMGNVGGFNLRYEPRLDGAPTFTVGRRDMRVRWNWEQGSWDEGDFPDR